MFDNLLGNILAVSGASICNCITNIHLSEYERTAAVQLVNEAYLCGMWTSELFERIASRSQLIRLRLFIMARLTTLLISLQLV